MMHDVVGMVLIAVLFVLVVASLAIPPGEGRTAPPLPSHRGQKRSRSRYKPLVPNPRRSAAWLSVLSAFKALSPSRS